MAGAPDTYISENNNYLLDTKKYLSILDRYATLSRDRREIKWTENFFHVANQRSKDYTDQALEYFEMKRSWLADKKAEVERREIRLTEEAATKAAGEIKRRLEVIDLQLELDKDGPQMSAEDGVVFLLAAELHRSLVDEKEMILRRTSKRQEKEATKTQILHKVRALGIDMVFRDKVLNKKDYKTAFGHGWTKATANP